MDADKPLKVLLVDDHDIVRRGLAMLMSRHDDLTVVGEAEAAADAVELTRQLEPDVVVLDMRLPDASGLEPCRDIRDTCSDTKVLMLTSYSDEEAVIGSIMAGASEYLPKEIRSYEIVEAVRQVGAGQSLLDPAVTSRVLDRVR